MVASPLDAATCATACSSASTTCSPTRPTVLAEVGPDAQELLGAVARPPHRRQAAAGGLPLLGLPGAPASPTPTPLVRLATRDGVLPGGRADPRRRHGRQRHPPRHAGRAPRRSPPGTSSEAGPATPTGSGWPAPSSPATSASTGPRSSTRPAACPPTTSRAGAPVFDRMRTQLMGGQFLDVVESARSWDGLPDGGAGRAGRAGDPLQEREVHRRAPAAHRCHRRAAPTPTTSPRCRATASTSARPSSCATTCSGCSATPPRPASPPATTCARASAPCWSPTPSRAPTTRGRELVEARLGRPRPRRRDGVGRAARGHRGRGRGRRGRGRDRPARRDRPGWR